MLSGRKRLATRINRVLRDSTVQVIDPVGQYRNRILATITLTTLLVAIFQIELIVANILGYATTVQLLGTFSREGKMVLAATAGPFLHQGPRHLVDNLGVLLLAGAYLEYEYDRLHIYTFYLGAGYIAAWVPLSLGFAGAVGASGVTYGLVTWLLAHSISRILEMAYEGTFGRRVLHSLPFVFGFIKTNHTISILKMVDGADDVSHLIGAFVGLLLGLYFVFDYHTSRSNSSR